VHHFRWVKPPFVAADPVLYPAIVYGTSFKMLQMYLFEDVPNVKKAPSILTKC
jgi:hypothetical protein